MTILFPTPAEITKYLRATLPKFTDLFTGKLTVSSAEVLTGNILAFTAVKHGFKVGSKFVISSGTVTNPVASAVETAEVNVEFTFLYDHDATAPRQVNDPKTILMSGFSDDKWNTALKIVSVPNRRNIIVNYPAGATTVPLLSGAVMQEIASGLIGAHTVTAVPSPDVFKSALVDVPDYPVGPINDIEIISGFRIHGAASIDRAEQIYTKKQTTAYTLFVIMGDVDSSKDQRIDTDASVAPTGQTQMRIDGITNFSTTVFLPTDESVSGVEAQTDAYGVIFSALLQALFGASFGSGSSVPYKVGPAGHGQGLYNSAYYTHVFDWQIISAIDFTDGNLPVNSVAFRDLSEAFDLLADENAVLEMDVNLDDVPN